ncbi:MAG: Peptidyl-prolyl cis-trans isomerase [Candidatus Kuenenbacteria bacterium GW2011_GWA2_42_15]|uniref:Peptidyl-prolyl cis-trans isomerase n=1 Tax=Candidatus Kuenenbacteria bacterium GW2011_GWA2_42_15 TaxID=1618677 RepID=A0A0G1B2R2_9BACT|nr:MAG: Peptidyl-prolyl cis-trans isomerase [Candidatus Kuenenbacteria bacterium GW2011_GWA2_42_15]
MKKISILFLVILMAGVSVGCVKNGKQTAKENKETVAGGVVGSWELPAENNQTAETATSTVLVLVGDKTIDLNTVEVTGFSKAILKTNFGDITVQLYSDLATTTVISFLKLAKAGFYDGTKFHRIVKDFMIQAGDPNSRDNNWADDGAGGPGYTFNDEINDRKLVRGSLAMANAGVNTNGSQFFIVTATSTPWLDGLHTNFGQVTKGLEIVGKIQLVKTNENDHPTEDAIIQKIELVK